MDSVLACGTGLALPPYILAVIPKFVMRHWSCSLVHAWLWKTVLNSDAVKNSSRPWRTSAMNFTHQVRHLELSFQPFRNCVSRLQQLSSLRAAHIMLHFLRFHPVSP